MEPIAPVVGAPCTIIPPYLLAALAESADPAVAARARRTLQRDERRRRERLRSTALRSGAAPAAAPAPAAATDAPQRTVFDAAHGETLPGTKARGEGDPAVDDLGVNEAFDGLGDTWQLFFSAYSRNSLDAKGMPLNATVHYGTDYDNAYWDGEQMVFGDGDGVIFGRFTASLDVIGHELTHGVTEHTAGLRYHGQSGALNESISDVFGVLVAQWKQGQTAEQADWLIGAQLLLPAVHGVALRSMKAPGTAYDDPRLGKDPQPAHLDGYVHTADDNGGVHINSGIPNKAFYLAASAIGGNAWETAGPVWYDVLTGGPIQADCDFATFAALTIDAAGARYGADSTQQQAVRSAWAEVGVTPAGTTPAPAPEQPAPEQPVPAPRTGEVTVRRTGGFAGIARVCRVSLDDLPERVASCWTEILDRPADETPSPRPDGFVYEFSVADEPPVVVPEHEVPQPVRDQLRQAMDGGRHRAR